MKNKTYDVEDEFPSGRLFRVCAMSCHAFVAGSTWEPDECLPPHMDVSRQDWSHGGFVELFGNQSTWFAPRACVFVKNKPGPRERRIRSSELEWWRVEHLSQGNMSHICGPRFAQEYKENLAAAEASKAADVSVDDGAPLADVRHSRC